MGHNLAIILVRNSLFIGLYRINMDVIHLLVLLEHWYCAQCLDTNVICLFVLFKHKCCMSICVVYTWKSYTWLLCLKNARHPCSTNTNLWNNKFRTDLEWTHQVCKFVMNLSFKPIFVRISLNSNIFLNSSHGSLDVPFNCTWKITLLCE
jgi:hypothetical protein